MAHHEPLKALGPIDWADVTGDDLSTFLSTTFSSAQTVIDSIPALPGQQQQTSRARSHTDSSVLAASSQSSSSTDDPTTTTTKTGRNHANTTAGADAAAAAAASAATAAQLLKEWKEVKVPPKDNPMDISVFRLGGKDGRGAWFARRSLHEGVPFDKFRLGLEREFGETMKNSKGPGTGNVRGIGAERRAERVVCEGVGKAEVWLLSAQFPGPTTPRDFLTLLLTGGSGFEEGEGKGKGNGPRQFMVVSRPCNHPECQPRSGYIRGNYESVEIIREVPTDKPVRRVRSSTDLSSRQDKPNGSEDADPEAGRAMSQSLSKLPDADAEEASADKAATETEMAIEWIMVTRSDPGGSVPRFMVEKGTPGGIVNDAGRFIKWLDSKKIEDLQEPLDDNLKDGAVKNDDSEAPTPTQDPSSTDVPPGALPETTELSSSQEDIQPSGFYNMIAGALGAMASRLPGIAVSATGTHTDDSDSDSEGSERSFASAQEVDPETPLAKTTTIPPPGGDNTTGAAGGENASTHSTKSDESSSKASLSQHEKALKKLQERQRKLNEKMARQQESNAQSKQSQGDDALAKLKEKHDREVARQEENYRKEVKKLEEKRLKEEKKAEEKRKKQQEKEERENMSMQLEKVKVERDVALKQIEILKEQVGELQAQNTKLVLQLGQFSKSEESIAIGARKLDEEKSS